MLDNSAAVFLVSDTIRAINVVYDEGITNPQLAKTFDTDIAVGDIVTIESLGRWGHSSCKVVEVDVTFDIQNSGLIRWVTGKIDVPVYEKLLADEKDLIEQVSSAKMHRERAKLAEDMMGDQREKFEGLALASPSIIGDAKDEA